ncbi:TetR/AcrR family transcriptional regulator [Streptomyces drozdowiczii]|uniref:TetR/AcrR family transcriptional regulator n=1 Tax=Streptomyces drozdowiczii TaxID=202862 RepID=A0ABY6PKP1_9ACTN|nr:TetR/AcrR family transcriptional regulator [Streptomyces drozdowiczii]MCX0247828.1 TetR/AcrR family transcriptional regulator [Streptomyces drozdowiczii]UZK52813.1 TetR/AcrR family transcriptional regulator [Streptomyces drozdowiczii]
MSAGESKGSGSSGGYAKGRARREQIVATAAEVYGDVGYRGASLREIAKRAGISHVGLMYYFPSREALLAAVLERRDEEEAARSAPVVSSPRDAMLHLLDLAGRNAGHAGMVELYVRLAAEATPGDHPAHGYFERHYEMVRSYAHRALEELAVQGALRDGVDARTAAVGLVALMDGLQVQWLTSPDEVDMAGVLRAFVQQLLKEPLE